MLDTDIEQNDPWNRGISARLYIGDIEQRLRQEIVLGIGGAEVLEILGIKHHLLHLNEGHAAFAILERIRDRVQEGLPYSQALERVKNTTVFTTHTPVPAGHDVIPFHLMEKYFQAYWPALGLDRDTFLQLGIHPEQPHAGGFNMTALPSGRRPFATVSASGTDKCPGACGNVSGRKPPSPKFPSIMSPTGYMSLPGSNQKLNAFLIPIWALNGCRITRIPWSGNWSKKFQMKNFGEPITG